MEVWKYESDIHFNTSQVIFQPKELFINGIHFHTFTLPYFHTSILPACGGIVGKDGFEPPNSEENRFTVCCRWPLDYLPDGVLPAGQAHPISGKRLFRQLSQRRESNPRPADYKSAALPSELLWHVFYNKLDLTDLQRTKRHTIIRPFFWEGKGKRIC